MPTHLMQPNWCMNKAIYHWLNPVPAPMKCWLQAMPIAPINIQTENQDLRLLGLRLLESANLTEQDIEWIAVDTFQEAARRLINQEADAAFFLVSTYLHFMPNTRKQMKTLMQSRIGDLYHIILLHPDDAELHDFFRDTFIQIGNTDDGEKVLQDLDMRGFDAVSQEDMEFMIDLMETLKD